MWERFKRMIRSVVGFFIELGEDPELILKQNLRDMEDQIPEMNKNIALVRSAVTLLEKEVADLTRQDQELTAKIKAALKMNRRDVALTFANTLETVRKDLKASQAQLEINKQAYEKANRVKRHFLNTVQQKSREVASALSTKRRAEWQSRVAEAMGNFSVAGIDATHDEMIRKIEAASAMDEAKMEVALDNVNAQQLDIEEEAKKLQASDTLRQFEIEMGIVSDGVSRTANAVPETEEDAEAVKTIGSEILKG